MPLRTNATVSIKACGILARSVHRYGVGEDVYANPFQQDVAASFAYAYLLTVPGNAVVWQGWLDLWGCMPNTVNVPNGTYRLQQSTTWTGFSPYRFHVYFWSGGYDYEYQVWADCTANSSGTYYVHPTFNNAAIQVSGVVSRMMAYQLYGLFGGVPLGMVGGSYTIRTNQGCSDLTPPTDSCYSPSGPPWNGDGRVHIGTTVINGWATANWKNIIGHEIGHMVQYRAMGYYNYDYSDPATEPACQCTHDPLIWGNTVHCLQSREPAGGAQLEAFAHAFANRLFNENQANGSFAYYKPFARIPGASSTRRWRATSITPSAGWSSIAIAVVQGAAPSGTGGRSSSTCRTRHPRIRPSSTRCSRFTVGPARADRKLRVLANARLVESR